MLAPAPSRAVTLSNPHAPRLPLSSTRVQRRHVRVAAEPFNEGAAQVKRLISRDRKEFMGNDDDILDKYETEFGAPSSSSSQGTTATATPVVTAKTENPFGAAPSSSPFGSSKPAAAPFKKPPGFASIEPAGLRPDMGPDPMAKEKPFNILENITLTQIVLFFSFTLIIALMIGTFYFVLGTGAIRLNGI